MKPSYGYTVKRQTVFEPSTIRTSFNSGYYALAVLSHRQGEHTAFIGLIMNSEQRRSNGDNEGNNGVSGQSK